MKHCNVHRRASNKYLVIAVDILYLTVERAGRHPSWMDREKLYGGLSTSLLKFVRHLILGNATLKHTGAYSGT